MTRKAGDSQPVELNKWLYVSFVLFGIAQLLPWNIYVKSIPYFRHQLVGTDFAASIAGYMTSGYTLTYLFTMMILVIFRWDEYFIDTKGRIIFGIAGNILLMAFMVLVPIINFGKTQLVISVVIICGSTGVVTAFLLKGLFGMAARFPPTLTPALLGGQAVAGLLVSTANAITTATIGSSVNSEQTAVGPIIYFATGCGVLILVLICFLANCMKSTGFRWYMKMYDNDPLEDCHSPESGHKHSTKLNNSDNTSSLSKRVPLAVILKVLNRIRWFVLGILVTLTTTVSLFVTFITAPRLAPPETNTGSTLLLLYVPIIFIIYDTGDLMGRWMPTVKFLDLRSKPRLMVFLPWVMLIAFAPLYFLIAPVSVTSNSAKLPSPLGTIDVFYALLTFALGTANGYCCTNLLMHAPGKAIAKHPLLPVLDPSATSTNTNVAAVESQEIQEREACGALMGLSLNIGLTIGALSSFTWRHIL